MGDYRFKLMLKVLAVAFMAVLCTGANAGKYKITYVHNDHLGRPVAGTGVAPVSWTVFRLGSSSLLKAPLEVDR